MELARSVRQGLSIAFAVDGPVGPAHHAQPMAVDWARMTGRPVWLFTYSVERYRRLPSWDRMVLPRGGGRGVILYRRWDAEVPRRMDEAGRERLRAKLGADLDALTLEADRLMGHPGLIA
jgi:lysophospholipid acyltransferase (LPLAT)-like uncharacterized protein